MKKKSRGIWNLYIYLTNKFFIIMNRVLNISVEKYDLLQGNKNWA